MESLLISEIGSPILFYPKVFHFLQIVTGRRMMDDQFQRWSVNHPELHQLRRHHSDVRMIERLTPCSGADHLMAGPPVPELRAHSCEFIRQRPESRVRRMRRGLGTELAHDDA